MNNKILLLSVAVLAVGLFAMPSSLSLFAGQHTFDNGTGVRCEKCHSDIYEEIKNTNGLYGFGIGNVHTSSGLQQCIGCHKSGSIGAIPVNKTNKTGQFTLNLTASGAHAAVTLECVTCHSGVDEELLNSSEAHSDFYNETVTNVTFMQGANEACVGCHTHINVNGTWRRSVGYDMIVNESIDGTYIITMEVNSSVNTSYTQGGNITPS